MVGALLLNTMLTAVGPILQSSLGLLQDRNEYLSEIIDQLYWMTAGMDDLVSDGEIICESQSSNCARISKPPIN